MIKNYDELFEYKITSLQDKLKGASKNEKPKIIFAINLVRLRQENNVSQIELANGLKVSHRYITRWEGAFVAPTLYFLMSVAKFFNVKVDDLLTL